MSEYHVIWEIDVSADNPVEAARMAQAIQRDPTSWAAVFTVNLLPIKQTDSWSIDLDPDNYEPPVEDAE